MKRNFSCFSALYDLLIDFALMAMGYLIYYHFNIHPLAPMIWNPLVIQLFGSKELAILILAGVPFIVGVLSFARTLYRILLALKPRSMKS